MTDAVVETPSTPHQLRLRALETGMKWATLVVALALPVCVGCAFVWDAWTVVFGFMGLLAVWTLGIVAYAVVAASPYIRFSLRALILAVLALQIPVLFLFHSDGFVVVIGFLLLFLWFILVSAMLARSIWRAHAAMHPSPAALPPEPHA